MPTVLRSCSAPPCGGGIQPDTMSLSATVNSLRRAGSTHSGLADAALKNLYGLPAVDCHRGQPVRPVPLSFPGYEDFTFHDAMPYRGRPDADLGEVRTDAQAVPCAAAGKAARRNSSIAAFLSKALSRAAGVP
ncbi:MAG: hypothetical protein ACLRWP_09770 [Bilophila wadsworthia]